MTRTPSEPEQPRRRRRARLTGAGATARLARAGEDLERVLSQLAAGLARPVTLSLASLLERALRDAVRACRGAADAHDGANPRWTALFNRLLESGGDSGGERLAAALMTHAEVRVSDGRAAASVVVHAIEGLVRRSTELPNARARADARSEVVRMLKLFLGAR